MPAHGRFVARVHRLSAVSRALMKEFLGMEPRETGSRQRSECAHPVVSSLRDASDIAWSVANLSNHSSLEIQTARGLIDGRSFAAWDNPGKLVLRKTPFARPKLSFMSTSEQIFGHQLTF